MQIPRPVPIHKLLILAIQLHYYRLFCRYSNSSSQAFPFALTSQDYINVHWAANFPNWAVSLLYSKSSYQVLCAYILLWPSMVHSATIPFYYGFCNIEALYFFVIVVTLPTDFVTECPSHNVMSYRKTIPWWHFRITTYDVEYICSVNSTKSVSVIIFYCFSCIFIQMHQERGWYFLLLDCTRINFKVEGSNRLFVHDILVLLSMLLSSPSFVLTYLRTVFDSYKSHPFIWWYIAVE